MIAFRSTFTSKPTPQTHGFRAPVLRNLGSIRTPNSTLDRTLRNSRRDLCVMLVVASDHMEDPTDDPDKDRRVGVDGDSTVRGMLDSSSCNHSTASKEEKKMHQSPSWPKHQAVPFENFNVQR
eukprot:m.218256 g.218256  ORF g.218256 m.218256 type:complete len:123 (-) comp16993_c1_seq24:15-383(-)